MARPLRPLPSANGWIVSNWACAMAAWVSAGMSSRRMKATRSSIAGSTRLGCGGTNSAVCGEFPRIQFLAVFEVASGPFTDTSAATRNVTVAALDYRAVREQGNRR